VPVPSTVTIRNKPDAVTKVVFRATPTGPAKARLKVTLDFVSAASFFVSGKFPRSSRADGDAVIQVVRGPAVLAEVPVMVRIRRNANKLSKGERERFLAAFATLNDQGAGRFVDFRNMHTSAGSPEAHGDAGFLPWHRASCSTSNENCRRSIRASRFRTGASISRRRGSSRATSWAFRTRSGP
jgi:tyrosinase